MEEQNTPGQFSDPAMGSVTPEFTTGAVPRARARDSQEAKGGHVATRRSFILKSVGALGGVALGVYLAPSLNTLRVPSAHAHAQVSPCPTSSSTSDSLGSNPNTSSLCSTSDH